MHSSKSHNGRIRVSPSVSLSSKSSSQSPPLVNAGAGGPPAASDATTATTTTATPPGRSIQPLPLETPSTYQTLVSTLSVLGPIASGSTRTVGNWGKQAYTSFATGKRRVSEGGQLFSFASNNKAATAPTATANTAAPTAPDVDLEIEYTDDTEEHAKLLDDQLSASIHHQPSTNDDPVIWSTWDTLPASPRLSSKTLIEEEKHTRVLIQVFASGRIIIWDATSLSELVGVLNKDFTTTTHLPLKAKFISPLDAEDKHGHVLAILTAGNAISLYSTTSHRTIKTLEGLYPGQIVDFQVNERFLVAASIQPLSLQVWHLPSFTPTSFSPILDIAPHPYDLTPVYCLSSSRMLAYSSTSARLHGGGSSGIIATSGWKDDDITNTTTTAASSSFSTSREAGVTSASKQAHYVQATPVDYGETARRWGEGMMSHMKSVTDYGYSRYYGSPTAQQQHAQDSLNTTGAGLAIGQGTSPHQDSRPTSALSKSAPHSMSPLHARSPENQSLSSSPASGAGLTISRPAYSPRLSSRTSSSSVVVLDLVASSGSSSSSSSTSRPTSSANQRTRSPLTGKNSNSSLAVIAHFRPSENHPLTLLSINPTGTLILTSSSEGHSFHIFELRPPSSIGNSLIRTSLPSSSHHQHSSSSNINKTSSSRSSRPSLAASNQDLKVWHRYRLNRGLTVAQTVAAHWSEDSRFVLVSTAAKGTVHVYPINPLGGKPSPESHLSYSINNATHLAPLSVVVNAIARIKTPKLPALPATAAEDSTSTDAQTPRHNLAETSPPSMLFVQLDSPLPSLGTQSSLRSSTSPYKRSIPVLLFYPHLHSILQPSIHLSASPKTADSSAPLTTRVTSQPVSGLTQMMRNRASALPTLESEVLLGRLEWRLQWPLAPSSEAMIDQDVRVDLRKLGILERRNMPAANIGTYAHEAEIETFSHAPAVLPRSIYLAQTVTFHTYPPTSANASSIDIARQFSLGDFSIKLLNKVTVREEVYHRLGAGEAFDESTELHSAMHTILDAANISTSHGSTGLSPSNNSPAFPNGYGKSSSSSRWLPSPGLSSLPIPIGISPSTVRQAATKVRKYSSNLRSPRIHPVGSHGGSGQHSLHGSSLSFEDDDAVMAQHPPEMLEVDEEGVDLGQPSHRHSAHPHPVNFRSTDGRYGSPSPAPVPSLSAGTASSAESHTKSSEYHGEPRRHDTRDSPAMQASITEEERQNEGEWDSFKLDGIDDDEENTRSGNQTLSITKPKLPSPLLSHAMLPLLAVKSESFSAAKVPARTVLSASPAVQVEHAAILAVPESKPPAEPATNTALTMADTPLDSFSTPSKESSEAAAVLSGQLDASSPSPLSSSPAISSNELSASPAISSMLAGKKKKKVKKGKA